MFLAAGGKVEDIMGLSRRDALDRWLEAPSDVEAASEQALLRYLQP